MEDIFYCVLAEIGCMVPGLRDSEVNGKCQASSNDTWEERKIMTASKAIRKMIMKLHVWCICYVK